MMSNFDCIIIIILLFECEDVIYVLLVYYTMFVCVCVCIKIVIYKSYSLSLSLLLSYYYMACLQQYHYLHMFTFELRPLNESMDGKTPILWAYEL